MKSAHGKHDEIPNGRRKNSLGSASESMAFDTHSSAVGVRRYSDSGSPSNAISLSRFPYHERRRDRARSLSEDDKSLESGDLAAAGQDDTGEHPPAMLAKGRMDRGDPNNIDTSGHSMLDDLDESCASLVLEESPTLPDPDAAQTICWNFAMEHRIFLKAALALIAERDKAATEVGMNDPNIFKSGPLKKASHLMKGVWKVKYVEIRRGMFSYYEDAVSARHMYAFLGTGGAEIMRKNVPLEANACECRAVRLHQKALNITPRGAIFELAISGRPTRLWMANSRAERQAWIQAIHDAMVGGSVTRGGNPAQTSAASKLGAVDARSPHHNDVKKYQKVQALLRNAKCKEDYVIALRQIYKYDLNVPVKWIAKQAEQESKGLGSSGNTNVKGAFHEEDVKSSVDQLFKDLRRDKIKIDDEIYEGRGGHAPERIMGALARRIMQCGRRGVCEGDTSNRGASKYDMNESQALAYARDILLSGNRTRSGGDSYFCVNTLCKNEDLIVLVPSSAEAAPVSITVSRDADESAHQDSYSRSGWLRTRRRTRNDWVKYYFELSEGTLSYYEHASPRPHGLRGQLSLLDATISIEREKQKGEQGDCFVLVLTTKDKMERQILFESEEKMLIWAYALECTAKAKGGTAPAPFMKAMSSMIAGIPKVPMPVVNYRRASLGMGMGMGMGMGIMRASTMEEIRGKIQGPYSRASTTDDIKAKVQGHNVKGEGLNNKVEKPNSKCEGPNAKVEGPNAAEAAVKEHVANLGLDLGALEKRLAAYANQQSTWVKASIVASTVYKVCTLDPEGDENEDTWAVVDATFLQEFRVTGGPNPRIMRGEEIVRVDIAKCLAMTLSGSAENESTEFPNPDSPGRATMQRILQTLSGEEGEYRGPLRGRGKHKAHESLG